MIVHHYNYYLINDYDYYDYFLSVVTTIMIKN